MAVVPGYPDAVRELRPVPRARFLFAGERRQADILIAGTFSEAPQVGVKGFCGIHAAAWGWAGFEGALGAGRKQRGGRCMAGEACGPARRILRSRRLFGGAAERNNQFRAAPIRARTGPGLPLFSLRPAGFSQKPAWFRKYPADFTPENDVRVWHYSRGRSRTGPDCEQAGTEKTIRARTEPGFPVLPGRPAWFSRKPAWFRVNPEVFTPENDVRE